MPHKRRSVAISRRSDELLLRGGPPLNDNSKEQNVYDSEQNRGALITVYRDPTAETKRRGTRYREINVDRVVDQWQETER